MKAASKDGGGAAPKPVAAKAAAAGAKPIEAVAAMPIAQAHVEEIVTVTGQARGVATDVIYDKTVSLFAAALMLRANKGTLATRLAEVTPAPTLAKNAIVRSYVVKVQAGPADLMPLTVVQTRASDTRNANENLVTVIVDFGVMVTVAAVMSREPAVVQPYNVLGWNGQSFPPTPVLYQGTFSIEVSPAEFITLSVPSPVPPSGTVSPADVVHNAPSSNLIAYLGTETRTERLKIDVVSTANLNDTAGKLAVQIPDAPSNLELRVNGGTPAWTHPAPVRPDPGVTKDEFELERWNAEHVRLVELKDAIAPLGGDFTSTAETPLNLALTAQIPGLLALSLYPQGQDIVFGSRLDIGSEGRRDLTFASEGLIRVPLTIDAMYTKLEAMSYSLTAKLPMERVQPPVGPERSKVADLRLDATLAACARIPAVTKLVKLTGIRLPLIAGEEGAEVRVVLLQNVVPEGPSVVAERDSEPGEPVDGGTSQPITMSAGKQIIEPPAATTSPPSAEIVAARAAAAAADDASWTTFTFDKPVEIEEHTRPWVAVHVSRGQVTWSLARYPSVNAVVPIRRGPPAGPWLKLPSMFRPKSDGSGDPNLIQVGGRLRAVGLASADAPLAPLILEVSRSNGIGGGTQEATPTPKGVPVKNIFAPLTEDGRSGALGHLTLGATPTSDAGVIDLMVTSRVAGDVTLRDVDVIVRKD